MTAKLTIKTDSLVHRKLVKLGFASAQINRKNFTVTLDDEQMEQVFALETETMNTPEKTNE